MADDRIARGMERQLALRAQTLGAGARQIGWKVGFGAPEAKARLRIERALVGFLTDRGVLADGAQCSVAGWVNPAFEAEIAVHLERDVAPDAGRAAVEAAIAGAGPAIELADVDPPPDDVEAILACNIFHRHVLLGPLDRGRRSAQGVTARVLRDGEEVARTDDPAALTGELVDIVRGVAASLAECGEHLRAGEVIITGSVVPLVPVAAGQRLRAELPPLGALEVALTG